MGLERARLRTLPPVLKRHFQGDLDRRGAVVGKENTVEAGGRAFDEPPRQSGRRHVADAEQCAVGNAVKLPPDGRVELGHTMAVEVAPQRRDAVNIAPAVEVDQVAAFGAVDQERRFLGVSLHRREGVPDVLAVPSFELFAGGVHEGSVCPSRMLTKRLPRGREDVKFS